MISIYIDGEKCKVQDWSASSKPAGTVVTVKLLVKDHQRLGFLLEDLSQAKDAARKPRRQPLPPLMLPDLRGQS